MRAVVRVRSARACDLDAGYRACLRPRRAGVSAWCMRWDHEAAVSRRCSRPPTASGRAGAAASTSTTCSWRSGSRTSAGGGSRPPRARRGSPRLEAARFALFAFMFLNGAVVFASGSWPLDRHRLGERRPPRPARAAAALDLPHDPRNRRSPSPWLDVLLRLGRARRRRAGDGRHAAGAHAGPRAHHRAAAARSGGRPRPLRADQPRRDAGRLAVLLRHRRAGRSPRQPRGPRCSGSPARRRRARDEQRAQRGDAAGV